MSQGPAFQDLSGNKYGKLTVVKFVGIYKSGTKWALRCDCGKLVIRLASNFKKKQHRHSCGCVPTNPGKRDTGLRRMFFDYKSNAKNRGYSFRLTLKQFLKLVKKECFYCNSKPIPKYVKWIAHEFSANGLDRLDNKFGYSVNNCVPCCSTCNRAKSNLSKEEFVDWIKKVYYHLIEGK